MTCRHIIPAKVAGIAKRISAGSPTRHRKSTRTKRQSKRSAGMPAGPVAFVSNEYGLTTRAARELPPAKLRELMKTNPSKGFAALERLYGQCFEFPEHVQAVAVDLEDLRTILIMAGLWNPAKQAELLQGVSVGALRKAPSAKRAA